MGDPTSGGRPPQETVAEYQTIPAHEWLLARMRNWERHIYASDVVMFGEQLLRSTIPAGHDELARLYSTLCERHSLDPSLVLVKLRAEKARMAQPKVAKSKYRIEETTFGELPVHQRYLDEDGLLWAKGQEVSKPSVGVLLETHNVGYIHRVKDSQKVRRVIPDEEA